MLGRTSEISNTFRVRGASAGDMARDSGALRAPLPVQHPTQIGVAPPPIAPYPSRRTGCVPRKVAVLTDPRFEFDVQNTGTLPGVSPDALTQLGADDRREPPAWLAEARASVTSAGRYLVFEQDGRHTVVPLSREWTRIGRSLAADVRFDDATVSRRHALIANEQGGVRVLDDRSLNGIQVNGRRVEWSPLVDGDELVIGRHALYYLDTVAEPATAAPAALAE